jgi:NtrC-family two-component system sensor histidine kinase KinB
MSSDVVRETSSRASLDLLYRISRELAGALDLGEVLEQVLKLSLQYVSGSNGSVIVLDTKGRPVDSIIIVKDKVIEETTQQLRFTLDKGLAGWVVSKRQAVLVEDTSLDKRWRRAPTGAEAKGGPKSVVSAPLLVRDDLVGVITLTHPEPNFFNETHLELVQTIAGQAAIAVLNARLYAESQRRAQAMSAVAGSASAIGASLDIQQVLDSILEQTTSALNVEAVSLALVDKEKKNIVFQAATGEQSKNILGLSIGIGQGIAGWVAQKGESVIVPDAQNDERFYASVDQNTGYKTKAIACAPIRSNGNLIGVLEAINPLDGSFDEADLTVIEGIGNLAGAAIEHAQFFKQVEAARSRYRELFEDSIDPILITDWEGNISEANRQAELLSGFDKQTLTQMNIHHLHQADWKALGDELANLKNGKTISYESSLMGHGSSEIFVECYVHSIEVEGQQQVQWIMRDITERKNLDNLREDLASMIYHDLRSPLANVVSGLDVLEMMLPTDEDPTIRSVLDIAMRSTERVQRLATSLLDTSRMEAGQSIGKPEPNAVADLARDAIESVLPMAEAKEVKIETAVVKGLPKAMVDGEMIKRVLINLIENAIKYSNEGMLITIGAKRENDWIQLSVQDEGRGIPKEEQKRIFEKFTRVQVGATGKTKGLGLGLAYCKLAVEGHGGRIWVESEKGKGSKFLFTVPTA